MEYWIDFFVKTWFIWIPLIAYYVWYLRREYLRSKEYAKKYGEEVGKQYFRSVLSKQAENLFYGRGAGITCPNCGRVNVNYLDENTKQSNIDRLGLSSNYIGKTYECPSCRHTW